MRKYLNLRANIALGLIFAFFFNSLGPVPTAKAEQIYSVEGEFHLPAPGILVHLSPEFNPPILKGIKVHPDNPFRFDFILDQGDLYRGHVPPVAGYVSPQEQLKQESTRLIKYFLASLTIPEKDLWVNLSPYEKNRIVPKSFGQTEMGRDLLAEDYMLKQITASLIYPEEKTGKKFWKRIYEEAEKKFGTTNIPVNTFNKVWIVPEKAVVYENAKAGTAYIVESKLKVMLEQDYLSLQKHSPALPLALRNDVAAVGANIVREIVIPELTKEVNEGNNFSQLRQVYNSLILATWYKKKIKDSILAQVYEDKKKISGVGYKNSINIETIYQRYLQAFKKGVYNYIKEEPDPMTQQVIPRKYFSGGLTMDMAMMQITTDEAMVPAFANVLQENVSIAPFSKVDWERDSTLLRVISLIKMMLIRKSESVIKFDDPYTVIEGKDRDHFEVHVKNRKIEIRRDRNSIFGRIRYYFTPPNQKNSECFIYTSYIYIPRKRGDVGFPAIRGIIVPKEARGEGLGRFMIRVLLDKYPYIKYVHPFVRNAVLLKELIVNFGFKPVSPGVEPNAYYLDRDLTEDEIKALGYTPETYPKNRRAFISSHEEEKLLSGVPKEIREQYVVTDNLNVIAKDKKAVKLYLGKVLSRDPAMVVKTLDLQRDFQEVDSLGEGKPIIFITKEINTPESLALRKARWNPLANKLAQPLREVDRNAFVMVIKLGHKMSRENSIWQIEGPEPKGVAMRDDVTLIAFADEIVVLDTLTGKQIGKPIRDPLFKGLHSIEFHPSIKNRVLVSSGGIDRFLELEIDFKHSTHRIIYEWSAWKHGFNTNEVGVEVYERGQSLPKGEYEVLTHGQAVERIKSNDYHISRSIVVIDPNHLTHPLGVGHVFRVLDPNGVFYGKTPDKFIATLFEVGKLVEIDRSTGKMRIIDKDLSKPHGFVPYGDGYLLSDTKHGKVLQYDNNYQLVASYNFSNLPVNMEMESNYHADWIQYSTPLGDGLIASVDSRRSTIYVWDPSKKIYSSYPYNTQWVLQSVSPVLSKELSRVVESRGVSRAMISGNDRVRLIAYPRKSLLALNKVGEEHFILGRCPIIEHGQDKGLGYIHAFESIDDGDNGHTYMLRLFYSSVHASPDWKDDRVLHSSGEITLTDNGTNIWTLGGLFPYSLAGKHYFYQSTRAARTILKFIVQAIELSGKGLETTRYTSPEALISHVKIGWAKEIKLQDGLPWLELKYESIFDDNNVGIVTIKKDKGRRGETLNLILHYVGEANKYRVGKSSQVVQIEPKTLEVTDQTGQVIGQVTRFANQVQLRMLPSQAMKTGKKMDNLLVQPTRDEILDGLRQGFDSITIPADQTRFIPREIMVLFDIADQLDLPIFISGGTARDFIVYAHSNIPRIGHFFKNTDYDVLIPLNNKQNLFNKRAYRRFAHELKERLHGMGYTDYMIHRFKLDFLPGVLTPDHGYVLHNLLNAFGEGSAFSISRLGVQRKSDGNYIVFGRPEAIEDVRQRLVDIWVEENNEIEFHLAAHMMAKAAVYNEVAGFEFSAKARSILTRELQRIAKLSHTDKRFFINQLYGSLKLNGESPEELNRRFHRVIDDFHLTNIVDPHDLKKVEDDETNLQMHNKNIFIIPSSSDIAAETPKQMREFFNENEAIVKPLYEEAAQKLGGDFPIDRLLLGSLAADRTNLIVLCIAHALYVYAQYEVLQHRTKGNVSPNFITGNSIGFLISMVISGALTMDELMTFFKDGFEKMQEKTMATDFGVVKLPYLKPERIKKVLVQGQIEVLGYNLDNVTLAVLGDNQAVQEAAAGIVRRLRISPNDITIIHPPGVKGVHHSFYGESFERELLALTDQIHFKDAHIPIIDSSDPQTPVLHTADQVRNAFCRAILGPVYWAQLNHFINSTKNHKFIISSDMGSPARLERYALNEAMTAGERRGGIDLTHANMNLQIQSNNGEIKFQMNAAMLAQLQNASGFVPVIIKIQPMTNLRMFLGINDPVGVDKSV